MKRIKIQVKTSSHQNNDIDQWLEYFVLSHIVKTLNISNHSMKLVLYKALNKKTKGDLA